MTRFVITRRCECGTVPSLYASDGGEWVMTCENPLCDAPTKGLRVRSSSRSHTRKMWNEAIASIKSVREHHEEQNKKQQTKVCRACGKTKLAREFHSDAGKKDGLAYRCKECQYLYQQQRKRSQEL